MTASFGGLLVGLLVGLRHAFEPDHLAAIGTLVAEQRGARRGALIGAIWGLGHTLALVIVGLVMIVAGTALPASVAAAFECAVAVMLVALGVLGIRRALRDGAAGEPRRHRHGGVEHEHALASPHLHLGRTTFAWRPLAIGLVHGLAGSGALTAIVFAELPDTTLRIAYITLFGAGSVAGMGLASGLAGASLGAFGGALLRRRLALAAGAVSVVVGVLWGIPFVRALAA